MRFGFKTAPQNTTWADMLAVWTEADDIEVFESGWVFDHFYPIWSRAGRPDAAVPRGLDRARPRSRRRRAGSGWAASSPASTTGTRPSSPTWRRRSTSSPAGGSSSASARDGTRRSPGPTASSSGPRAQRSDRFEEACQVLIGLLSQETTDFDGEYYQLRGARCEPKGPQRPHPPLVDRRQRRAAHPPHGCQVRAALELRRAGRPTSSRTSARCCTRTAAPSGAIPAEITLSSHVVLHPDHGAGQTVDTIAALADKGLDLAIVYLMPPHDPAVLAPLAAALAAMD